MMQEQHRAMLDALKEIREDIGDIQLRMERGISQPSSSTIKAASPPPTPRGGDISQIGPSEDKHARGKAHDTAGVYVPPPARGAQFARPTHTSVADDLLQSRRHDEFPHPHHRDHDSHVNHRSLPKIHFPKFDGSCPKLWKQRCEDYFSLYGTHRSMWITVATMQFEGAAARWLQSVQHKLHDTSWEEFCSWLVTRFGRNQYQALLRQLYHMQQSTTVIEYVERFAELVDQLSAYEHNVPSLHYVTRFQDGLRHHIRAAVAIQSPLDLDTAYSLPLLQEEVGEQPMQHHHR
jgi:hypothetical protein